MKAIKISLSFLLFLFAIKIVAAQPGALDPSFGNGGIVDLHPNFTVDQGERYCPHY